MKSLLTNLSAAFIACLFCVSSCSPEGNRRGGPSVNPPAGEEFTENPDWTLTYTGRSVSTEGGVYVVDVVHMKAADGRNYYVDLVTADEFSSVYKSSIAKYIKEGSFRNLNRDYICSGDSDAVFDALDAGDGRWIAVAYEVTGGPGSGSVGLGRYYGVLKFDTRPVTMRKDDSYRLRYEGRRMVPDGDGEFEADVISVKAASDYSYYVDIAYPEYIRDNYGGNPVGFFNDVLDGLASGMESLDEFRDVVASGDLTVNFEALRHGDWTAYAFGVDYLGNLTGNWSEYSFVVEEEAPSADFRKWLGKWAIGSDGIYYNITVGSSEANRYFLIRDWETGNDASEWANQNVRDYQFEASYDRDSRELVFTSQYLGTLYDNKIGDFDVCFLGNIEYGGDIYSITDINVPVARARLDADGKAAAVRPETVTAVFDGRNYTTEYRSMQYIDITRTDNYVYNDRVPSLPMKMTRISDAPPAAGETPLSRPLPSRRGQSVSSAASPSARAGIRTAAGARPCRIVNGRTRTGGRAASGDNAVLRPGGVRSE